MTSFTHSVRSILLPWICLLVFTATVAAAEQRAVLMWGRFETAKEIARWQRAETQFELSSEFATSGRHCARLRFHRYGGVRVTLSMGAIAAIRSWRRGDIAFRQSDQGTTLSLPVVDLVDFLVIRRSRQ